MGRKSRTSVPWAGWGAVAPQGHARTVMMKKCGKKCFLGPRKSFPVCSKGSCRINSKGLCAAYVRARQWGKRKSSYKGKARPTMDRRTYKKVAKKAKSLLRRRGFRMRKYKGGSTVRAFPMRAYWSGMPSLTRSGRLDFTTKSGDLVFHRKGRYIRKRRNKSSNPRRLLVRI